VSAITAQFDAEHEALACVVPPHSMLYHPSAAITDHFRGAEDILLWAGIQDRATARNLLDAGDARLPDSLVNDLRLIQPHGHNGSTSTEPPPKAIEGEFNVLPPTVSRTGRPSKPCSSKR
jgi:hypothetical protein